LYNVTQHGGHAKSVFVSFCFMAMTNSGAKHVKCGRHRKTDQFYMKRFAYVKIADIAKMEIFWLLWQI